MIKAPTIAQLTSIRNVVVAGETGVGKSSLINLVIGMEDLDFDVPQVISQRSLEDTLPSSSLADTRDPAEVKSKVHQDNEPPRVQEDNSSDNSARFEKIIEQLQREFTLSQRAAEESLQRANDEIAQLKQANETLRNDLSENKEKYENEIEEWKSSYTAKENELATTHEALEELRRNQSQSVQPPPSKTQYEMQSNVHYGVACALPVDTDDEEHIRRRETWETDPTGECYVPGFFESKVRMGPGPHEEKEFRDAFSLIRNNPADFTGQVVRIVCYRGTLSDPKWLDEDETSFSVVCTIHVDLSEAIRDLVMDKDDSGEVYYLLDYDLIVTFGRTEIRAEVCWISGIGERRVPGRITFSED